MAALAYEAENEPCDNVDTGAYDANWRSDGAIWVNGVRRVPSAATVSGSTTLLEFLRNDCGLTGAKLGCGEGGCGACTVVVSSWDGGRAVHRSINGCLAPALSCVGLSVTTVEGMGTAADPHPIQKRLADCHGSQCGFCTPGIAMSLYALVKNDTEVADVEEHLDGNLCRCTGYRPIWDAAKSLCVDAKTAAPKCENHDSCGGHACDTAEACGGAERVNLPDIPFPDALKNVAPAPLRFGDFWRPTSVADAVAIKAHFKKDARFLCGCSEVAIEQRFRSKFSKQYVGLQGIAAMSRVDVMANGDLRVGGAAPLNDLAAACAGAPSGTAHAAAASMLRWFASTQIRNGASLGGNLATASPISDMNPLLVACGATLLLASPRGTREVKCSDFFLNYRQTALADDELLEAVIFPKSAAREFVRPYKQSRRREDDIAIVTATFRLRVDESNVITDACFAFGGLAATVKTCDATAAVLVGRPVDRATYDAAAKALAAEVALAADAPGGQPEYRAALAVSFWFKCFLSACADLGVKVDPADASGARTFVDVPKPSTKGAQAWPVVEKAAVGLEACYDTLHTSKNAPVAGASKKHMTGLLQVTGEAHYTDDVASANAAHACLVLAGRAGTIKGVDADAARALEGVLGVFTADDLKRLPNSANDLGAIVHDEECFATASAFFPGQVVGIAVGETYDIAKAAARLVAVDVEATAVPVSIAQAIASDSFFEMTRHEVSDAFDAGLLDRDGLVTVRGDYAVGGQEHFYLECNATLVTPADDGGLDVLTSTQAVTKTQACVANICGLPMHKVVGSVGINHWSMPAWDIFKPLYLAQSELVFHDS